MTDIHPSAVIENGAQISESARIGAFCVIGPDVQIGPDVTLHSHVVIAGKTSIGEGTEVFPFASLGHIPQDKKFGGEETRLEIGSFNRIREHVTMNPGTAQDKGVTKVGSHGLFLVGAHVAHDCVIGDHVVMVNNATLGGHCHVEDYAILGGLCAVHQFVRIGKYGFVGGMSGLENDLIPYGMALGNRAHLSGLNIVGLKRQNMDKQQIHQLRKAYRMLFSKEGTLRERIEDVEKLFGDDPNVRQILDFIHEKSDRSLCVPA